ncbi:MAG TPA: bifunctional oligoribonuclease/PAP phosphatase NrnA [Actinobacteria bacterium]|nr:bifunctional oligoribonuclease and PAP phosphatase NrnA [bacterium BMS3Bbin02]HDL42008.1 bifunctional oligoribonuclease/PAP phosphatase NrnA [Actinomycetota bacterium]
MTPFEEAMAEAVELIDGAASIVFLGHVGPDGDALGTIVGLSRAARKAGKAAVASFPMPFVLPRTLAFLDNDLLVAPGELPADVDLVVSCDVAAPDRLSDLLPYARKAPKLIVIDHHGSNEGFGDVNLIDPTAASTAQMAFHIIQRLGWSLDVTAATALYTGVLTDTGRFQYSMTTPHVHRIVAELLEHGVEPDKVGQEVYEQSPFAYLKVAGAVMSRAVFDEERKFVWSVLLRSDLEAASMERQDADGLIDLIRVTVGADVACLLKEIGENETKGSLRSRGATDVAAIAQVFGGGGHHNAAGFFVRKSPDEVIAKITELLV